MSPHKYTRAHEETERRGLFISGVIGFHYAKEEKVVPLAALLMVPGEKLITPVTHPRAKMVLLIWSCCFVYDNAWDSKQKLITDKITLAGRSHSVELAKSKYKMSVITWPEKAKAQHDNQ